HTLPSEGSRLIPKETPKRRDRMGPNTGEGKTVVDMITSFFGIPLELKVRSRRE
ncbi:hypothetical protein EZS27_044447, partial [termite gut metagenome]